MKSPRKSSYRLSALVIVAMLGGRLPIGMCGGQTVPAMDAPPAGPPVGLGFVAPTSPAAAAANEGATATDNISGGNALAAEAADQMNLLSGGLVQGTTKGITYQDRLSLSRVYAEGAGTPGNPPSALPKTATSSTYNDNSAPAPAVARPACNAGVPAADGQPAITGAGC